MLVTSIAINALILCFVVFNNNRLFRRIFIAAYVSVNLNIRLKVKNMTEDVAFCYQETFLEIILVPFLLSFQSYRPFRENVLLRFCSEFCFL